MNIWVPEGKKSEKEPEKLFEEIIAENFPNMGKDSQPSPGSTERPRQDKPKEEHTQTVIKLTKTKDR